MSKGSELMSTAVHEAGHAVVGSLLGLSTGRISIEPDENTLGRVELGTTDLEALTRCSAAGQRFEHLPSRLRGRLEGRLITWFAGPTAEAVFHRRRTWLPGHESDLGYAIDLADQFMSRRSAERYVRWLCERSHDYVTHPENWPAILALARELVDVGKISGRRAASVIKRAR